MGLAEEVNELNGQAHELIGKLTTAVADPRGASSIALRDEVLSFAEEVSDKMRTMEWDGDPFAMAAMQRLKDSLRLMMDLLGRLIR